MNFLTKTNTLFRGVFQPLLVKRLCSVPPDKDHVVARSVETYKPETVQHDRFFSLVVVEPSLDFREQVVAADWFISACVLIFNSNSQ